MCLLDMPIPLFVSSSSMVRARPLLDGSQAATRHGKLLLPPLALAAADDVTAPPRTVAIPASEPRVLTA
ncbi:hypothetical protein M9458_040744, partial [Cirrhinus mrigala]